MKHVFSIFVVILMMPIFAFSQDWVDMGTMADNGAPMKWAAGDLLRKGNTYTCTNWYEQGSEFVWGDISGRGKLPNLSKTPLNISANQNYDIVTKKIKNGRIPSRYEFNRLIKNCDIEYVNVPISNGGYAWCAKLISKINGNELYFVIKKHQGGEDSEHIKVFEYWTSSYDSILHQAMYIHNDKVLYSEVFEDVRMKIRPVTDEKTFSMGYVNDYGFVYFDLQKYQLESADVIIDDSLNIVVDDNEELSLRKGKHRINLHTKYGDYDTLINIHNQELDTLNPIFNIGKVSFIITDTLYNNSRLCVNNDFYGKIDVNREIILKEGVYNIKIYKDKYYTEYYDTIKVSNGQTIYVTPKFDEQFQTIVIKARNAYNTSIYLDGEYVGLDSCSVRALFGQHKVDFRQNFITLKSHNIDVKNIGISTIIEDFVFNPIKIKIKPKNASLWIGGASYSVKSFYKIPKPIINKLYSFKADGPSRQTSWGSFKIKNYKLEASGDDVKQRGNTIIVKLKKYPKVKVKKNRSNSKYWLGSNPLYLDHFVDINLGFIIEDGYTIGATYAYVPSRFGVYGSCGYWDAYNSYQSGDYTLGGQGSYGVAGLVLRCCSTASDVDVQMYGGVGWGFNDLVYDVGMRLAMEPRSTVYQLSAGCMFNEKYHALNLGINWVLGLYAVSFGLCIGLFALVA